MATNTGKKTLVIVESPAKASKIAGYLGKGYTVEASVGHVRDLPAKDSETPIKYKGDATLVTGVREDFSPIYVVNPDKKAIIKKLKAELADSSELLLATDEDREGEAISWHLLEELKPRVPTRRMVFHEITPKAIQEAVAKPRDLDFDLVEAQETRRILDRLFGYDLSPVLWRKMSVGLSAGRVQSVAVRLVVDRERERIAFTPADYSGITAQLTTNTSEFKAKLSAIADRRVATGSDFNAKGELKGNAVRLTATAAAQLVPLLLAANWSVTRVEARPKTWRPSAPFRTTTLQQEAGRKLGFTTDRTMRVAQRLYEGGFITYMRTDSVALSGQAVAAARTQIAERYGAEYLSPSIRVYDSKVKNAQEAHEAIRPAGETFMLPEQTGLSGDELKLYELIWKRTIASQMADAKGESILVTINAQLEQPSEVPGFGRSDAARFSASGETVTFPGFRLVYVDSVVRPDGEEDDNADTTAMLPPLRDGQSLEAKSVTADDHTTKPPGRYTEPGLVAKLEESEIGRPSTYAAIIATIVSKDYVFRRGKALVPTWTAFAVTVLLEKHFGHLVDYKFTAGLEQQLDQVAAGEAKGLDVLRDFYYGGEPNATTNNAGLKPLTTALGDIDARALSTFPISGSDVVVRVGKYGTYIEAPDGRRGNVPADMAPDELTAAVAYGLLGTGGSQERALGVNPETGRQVVAKVGRYGPYVTEVAPDQVKPATAKAKLPAASLLKAMDIDSITLDDALKLLSLPRTIGVAPDGEPVTAANGPYGPYVKKGSDYRQLATEEELFTVSLQQALELLALPKTQARATAAGRSSAAARELGTDPETGTPVLLKDGRYGPYVTDGKTNATVPRGVDAATIELAQAAELLAEKRAKGPTPPRGRFSSRSSSSRSGATKSKGR
ncbi:MAG: type I DNA topoisomerase [Propionibacteriaceae bacterium]|nr:type I DNA topoisomerase [Propionibacteriaceae bacterium]